MDTQAVVEDAAPVPEAIELWDGRRSGRAGAVRYITHLPIHPEQLTRQTSADGETLLLGFVGLVSCK